jgi:nitroreductase
VLIVLTLDDLVRENTLATGAAIENILLAATGRGLGACWMTFPFMQTKTGGQKIKRHLGIPPEDKIISCVVVGFPDRNSKLNQFKPSRKDPDSFIEWIGWE